MPQFTLSQVKRGDRVQLRYRGYNVAKRYGETWGTITKDAFNERRGWTLNKTCVIALDAIEGAERRVRLEEISRVERGGRVIAKRQQGFAPFDSDVFPLMIVPSGYAKVSK